jgi:hypothetical protein
MTILLYACPHTAIYQAVLLEGLGPRQLLHRGLAEYITPNVRARARACVCARARERGTTK